MSLELSFSNTAVALAILHEVMKNSENPVPKSASSFLAMLSRTVSVSSSVYFFPRIHLHEKMGCHGFQLDLGWLKRVL